MKHALQQLRDQAEKNCLAAADRGDRDSAEAWERVAIHLSIALDNAKHDFCTIDQRRGLMSAAERTEGNG